MSANLNSETSAAAALIKLTLLRDAFALAPKLSAGMGALQVLSLLLSERHTSVLRLSDATSSLCVVPSCPDPDYRPGHSERLARDRDDSRDRIPNFVADGLCRNF